jgi:peptidoglycan hydrolase CwlO-like protein
MILGTAVVCVAIVMSVVMFGLSIWLFKTSLSVLTGYMQSLMQNAEDQLGAIDTQIQAMQRQMDQYDTFLTMESGEMFDHEDDDDH